MEGGLEVRRGNKMLMRFDVKNGAGDEGLRNDGRNGESALSCRRGSCHGPGPDPSDAR